MRVLRPKGALVRGPELRRFPEGAAAAFHSDQRGYGMCRACIREEACLKCPSIEYQKVSYFSPNSTMTVTSIHTYTLVQHIL